MQALHDDRLQGSRRLHREKCLGYVAIEVDNFLGHPGNSELDHHHQADYSADEDEQQAEGREGDPVPDESDRNHNVTEDAVEDECDGEVQLLEGDPD